jgi:predicted aspartyl protease
MNRCLRNCFLLSAVLTLGLFALAQSRNPRTVNDHSQPSGALGSLEFDLYRDYLIVVRGSAGGLSNLNLLVDTGADPTLVDQRLARRLQLPKRDARIAVLNQTVATESAILPELEVGPLRTNNLLVLVQDLSFLEKGLQVRIDAVIGLDALGQNSFTIDYKSTRIYFGQPPTMPFSLPLRFVHRFITVDVKLNGQSVRLMVDTGASSLILFATRIQGRIPDLQVQNLKSSANLAGQFERKQVLLHDMSLGDVKLGQKPAFVVDDQKDPGRDFDGLLSLPALGFKEVAFDFLRGTVGWSR